MSALTLAESTAKRVAAEDLHGRVFATACQIILRSPNGPSLVASLEQTYRAMQSLQREEMDCIANGKITEALIDRQL